MSAIINRTARGLKMSPWPFPFESIWRSTCARKGNGAPSDAEVIVFALAIAQRLKPASEKLHEAAVSLQTTGQVRFDEDALLDVRATILDALAFLKTFRRGPDGESTHLLVLSGHHGLHGIWTSRGRKSLGILGVRLPSPTTMSG